MSGSHTVNRRDFVKVLLGALGGVMGAVIGIPAITYIIWPATRTQAKEDWIPAGVLENYPIGQPTLFTFTRTQLNGWEKTSNSYGAYILRKSDKEVAVFSSMCTHLACRVKWMEDESAYVCPCHDARFGLGGEVLSGPPPRPLDKMEAKVEEGNLFIFFKEG